jgi:propionate CoA-transferase
VTERCVPAGPGLRVTEFAPGIDVEHDILRLLPFAPRVGNPVLMDLLLLTPAPMRLRETGCRLHTSTIVSQPRVQHGVRNYAGMRVKSEDDIRVILDAVDRLLAPLGKRVNSIVNYDRFVVDDDATDAYMDAVRYVEEKYYLKVTRYTNSSFMRMKLGKELENRKLSSRVFESADEAKRNLESRS